VGIEAVLGVLGEKLAEEPLLADFAESTNAGSLRQAQGRLSTAQVAKNATRSAQNDRVISQDDGPILLSTEEDRTLSAEEDGSLMRSRLRNEARAVETEIKFAGYLEQQTKSIAKLKAAEAVAIPEWMDYGAISGLSREMREKLERVRPATIGQASRMPGVTPAALSLVHVSIRLQGARRPAAK
jgi:tRNA U34 5-carboxymethylaminomethyl modifying enzyme MnmG/GidA